jgi:hypothetical protein
LSFNWKEVDYIKNLIEHTIHTSNLRFKYLTLSVVKQMQNLLDMKDLGRAYYQCLRHTVNGSSFFVVVKNLKQTDANGNTTQISNPNLKLYEIDKLVSSRDISSSMLSVYSGSSSNLRPDISNDNFLFKNIKVK